MTKADLSAVGMTDPGLLDENAGQFSWTLSPDGSWQVVQVSLDSSPLHNPIFRGDYTVDGDLIHEVIRFPPEYAGTEDIRWSLDGTNLTTITVSVSQDPLANQLAQVFDKIPWTRP